MTKRFHDTRPVNLDDVRDRIEATDLGEEPAAMRDAFARLAGPHEAGRTIEIGGVEALAFGSGPALIWFHGGGYLMGSPETHAGWAAAVSAVGLTVIVPRYRLAPENLWPAQIEDALAVLAAVEPPMAIGGDSAGGHLAIRAALERPGTARALALVSPNTDRSGRSETRGTERDLMNDDATDARLARLAFGERAGDDPVVSPLLADLSALPPVSITAASNEVLLDDSLLFARAAARAGVPVDLTVEAGLFHLFTLWPDAIGEAAAAARRVGRFASAHLAR